MSVMKRAHQIRKEAAEKFNCPASEIHFGMCPEMAWEESKNADHITALGETFTNYDDAILFMDTVRLFFKELQFEKFEKRPAGYMLDATTQHNGVSEEMKLAESKEWVSRSVDSLGAIRFYVTELGYKECPNFTSNDLDVYAQIEEKWLED